jgi:hypothetical protein
MNEKLNTVNYRMFDSTKGKLEAMREKMSKGLNYSKVITWDTFFDILMNKYNAEINNSVEQSHDAMKEEICKVDNLRDEMKEYFKQQRNQLEELLGVVVKQKDNNRETETILQKITVMDLTLTEIKEFNVSMDTQLKDVLEKIKSLLSSVRNIFENIGDNIFQKAKHFFGISVSILLHNIIRDNNRLIKKSSDAETIKEVNLAINNFRNIYNSAQDFSDEIVEKIIDQCAMKEYLK